MKTLDHRVRELEILVGTLVMINSLHLRGLSAEQARKTVKGAFPHLWDLPEANTPEFKELFGE